VRHQGSAALDRACSWHGEFYSGVILWSTASADTASATVLPCRSGPRKAPRVIAGGSTAAARSFGDLSNQMAAPALAVPWWRAETLSTPLETIWPILVFLAAATRGSTSMRVTGKFASSPNCPGSMSRTSGWRLPTTCFRSQGRRNPRPATRIVASASYTMAVFNAGSRSGMSMATRRRPSSRMAC
jgi:hypothetical protein